MCHAVKSDLKVWRRGRFECAQPIVRVGDCQASRDTREQSGNTQQEPSTTRNRRRSRIGYEAAAQDHIAFTPALGLQQSGNIFRPVLAVRIICHDKLGALFHGIGYSRLESSPLSQIHGMTEAVDR